MKTEYIEIIRQYQELIGKFDRLFSNFTTRRFDRCDISLRYDSDLEVVIEFNEVCYGGLSDYFGIWLKDLPEWLNNNYNHCTNEKAVHDIIIELGIEMPSKYEKLNLS